MIRIATVAGLALAVAGCAGSLPGRSDQGQAGINALRLEDCRIVKGHPLCDVTLIGGKEQESVKLSVRSPSGFEADYEAMGVRAFDGQAVRGEVEKVVAGQVGESTNAGKLVDGIMAAIRATLGL